MPLYSVTCGDIGTSPEAVEKYLSSVLHLGRQWNCAFPRSLEYYDGVLILTSNRVGTFDEAFKSRIHVALHYPTLDMPSRRLIWINFFRMLRDDGAHADFDGIEAHLDGLQKHETNGREIRNAVSIARQLATFENERLELDHINQAMSTAYDFKKYLKECHGHSDTDWSRENRLR